MPKTFEPVPDVDDVGLELLLPNIFSWLVFELALLPNPENPAPVFDELPLPNIVVIYYEITVITMG